MHASLRACLYSYNLMIMHGPSASRHRLPRYAFAARRDRRRAAQALGAGREVARVAAAERVAPVELERLMREEGFQALVRHYKELAGLPREERLARLMT
ncbi:hypothetical protein SAMN07250955_1111, partial [Arboricoccus pini]